MNKFMYFLVFFLVFSCSKNSKNKLTKDNQIQLKVGKEAEKAQYFKEYFELDAIIPIETSKDFLIGNSIKRVLSYKNKLIILDSRSAIWVIDNMTGKVDVCIHRIGTGPGESKKIMDISCDEQTETIFVFNDYQNLLFFDLKGNFIRQEKFKKLYSDIIFDNGNLLFYNSGEGYSCYPYMIDKYNIQNRTLEKIGSDDKLDAPTRLYGRHIVKSKNIWFGTPYDFDLYRYTNSKIECLYKLKPEIPQIEKEHMVLAATDYPKFSVLRSAGMYGIGAIRETEHHLIFISSRMGFFIFNKEKNEIYWETYVDETSLGLKLLNYFSHDGDDNRIMFLVSPSEWLRRNKDVGMSNIPSGLREKIDSFIIDEDSNPILIFYREK